MAKYFGTNGARGIFGKDFTVELAKRIARGIGLYFNSGKILLARDGRVSSEALRNAAVEELLEIGAEVVDLGQASSPTAEFMVKKLKAAGLIIITASHNPPEWNGMKVVDGNGIAVSRERAEKIEQLMDAKAAASKK
jgi:phosphomannomutase/phosphoglucomutase